MSRIDGNWSHRECVVGGTVESLLEVSLEGGQSTHSSLTLTHSRSGRPVNKTETRIHVYCVSFFKFMCI